MAKTAGSGVSGPLLLVLALLAAASAPFAIDMYLPTFTDLAVDLDTSPSNVQLTLTAVLIGFAAGQLFFGPISDRFGRRRPLVLATALTVMVTVGCAIAPNIWLLVFMRFVQGFAASSGLVIGRAVAADRTTGAGTARVFTLFYAIGSVAPVMAPLLGGALAQFGWRAEFWALSGVFLLMFAGALLVVPESLPVEKRHTGGFSTTARAARSLMADPGFLGYIFAFAFGFAGLMSYISASPFVTANVLGMSTTAYAIILVTNAAGTALVGVASSRSVGRFGPDTILRTGQAVILVFGIALLVLFVSGAPAVAVLPVLFVVVASSPMVMGTASALAVGRARNSKATAAALMGSLQFTIGALVSPIVGLGGPSTGTPMAAMIVVSAGLAIAARRVARLSRHAPDEVAEGPGSPAESPACEELLHRVQLASGGDGLIARSAGEVDEPSCIAPETADVIAWEERHDNPRARWHLGSRMGMFAAGIAGGVVVDMDARPALERFATSARTSANKQQLCQELRSAGMLVWGPDSGEALAALLTAASDHPIRVVGFDTRVGRTAGGLDTAEGVKRRLQIANPYLAVVVGRMLAELSAGKKLVALVGALHTKALGGVDDYLGGILIDQQGVNLHAGVELHAGDAIYYPQHTCSADVVVNGDSYTTPLASPAAPHA